ncbi:hypothetical protein FOL47_003386 [Perkinsus chesapeaki]|uniref:Neuroguidin n=1 Tax=Perkinsus chesapeaki TaxID=330153 RepID=A0A7J6M8K5_PERCH|nr:hypothetical protein FOL47_003386 [Perkinsus chesapeaki]
MAALSPSKRQEVVAGEVEEYRSILAHYKECSQELEARTKPLAECISKLPELPDKGVVRFIMAKLELLMSYMANLGYYMRLKNRGISIAEHPVVKQLAWQRALMERMRPIEQKLKYQIDRLVKLASSEGQMDEELQDRPNLASLEKGLEEEEVAEEEEGRPGEQLYRAPKVAGGVMMNNDVTGGDIKKAERRLAALERSRAVRDLRDEFSDAPVVVGEGKGPMSAEDSRLINKWTEREEYEENNMLRLPTTKQNKAELRRLRSTVLGGSGGSGGTVTLEEVGEMADMAVKKSNLGDIVKASKTMSSGGPPRSGGRSLQDLVDSSNAGEGMVHYDDDILKARHQASRNVELDPMQLGKRPAEASNGKRARPKRRRS